MLLDPPAFSAGLGSPLWAKQASIARSVAAHPLNAVKACHSSGKTYLAAQLVVWWVARYPDGLALTTAPTGTQVRTLLWAEIHRALLDRVQDIHLLATEMKNKETGELIGLGRATNQGVRFQGFHGRILIVLDEAPGIRPDIWTAIEGIMAGGQVHVLALGNPTIASGTFFELFNNPRSAYQLHTISAFDTPNLAGVSLDALLAMDDAALDDNVMPWLTTRRWARYMIDKYGLDHPEVVARVLGEFPEDDELAIFPRSWVERAGAPASDPGGLVTAGVDVAGAGRDETVLTIRAGEAQVLGQWVYDDADARGKVIERLRPWRERLNVVNVDAIGIGYNFALSLKDAGLPTRFVVVSEASSRPLPDDSGPGFVNLKAEAYWHLRELLEAGAVRGLDDPVLRAQLSSILWSIDGRGRVVIEGKDAMAKRGLASPDRAEALVLALLPSAKGRNLSGLAESMPKPSFWRSNVP